MENLELLQIQTSLACEPDDVHSCKNIPELYNSADLCGVVSSSDSSVSPCFSPPPLISIIGVEERFEEEIAQLDYSLLENSVPNHQSAFEVDVRSKSTRKRNLPPRYCTSNGECCHSFSLPKLINRSKKKKLKKTLKLGEIEEKSHAAGIVCRDSIQNSLHPIADEIDGLPVLSFSTAKEMNEYCGKNNLINISHFTAKRVDNPSNPSTYTQINSALPPSNLFPNQFFLAESTQERHSRLLASLCKIDERLSKCLPSEYSFQVGITSIIDALLIS